MGRHRGHRTSSRRKEALESPGRSLSLIGRGLKNYLLKRPLGMAGKSTSEIVPSEQPLGKSPALREIDRRFVAKLFPRSMVAEQYRVAAARLQLLNAKGGPLIATVTSAIKGEGKTTTIVNLGYTLARDFGKQVLLLDCDFVYPELAGFTETTPRYGLIDCLKSDVPFAIIERTVKRGDNKFNLVWLFTHLKPGAAHLIDQRWLADDKHTRARRSLDQVCHQHIDRGYNIARRCRNTQAQ